MDWKDLTNASKNVLERCWGLHHDEPESFTATIGHTVRGELVTEDTAIEIQQYHQHFPHFDVKVEGNHIFVKGNCRFGSWI